MKSELSIFNSDQKKYLKKFNNLIKYYNFMVMCLLTNSNKYNNLKLYKKQTIDTMLYNLINSKLCLEKLQLDMIDVNKKFNLFLYNKRLINDDIFSKNVYDFVYIIDDDKQIIKRGIFFLKFININYELK